jgi:hypothetical protein
MRCVNCRGLHPADCPACQDVAQDIADAAEYERLLEMVHDEMYRDIGEPVECP